MDYKKYLIKKDKCDLLSSLKLLDKKITNKMMKEFGLEDIDELKEYIIDNFKLCLDMSKDDTFTKIYFQRLINNENSKMMSLYKSDIESLWAFVYENNGYYSYYIATEIKEIIKTKLKIK